MVKRECARATAQEKNQDRGPKQVLGPGLRINERLNHGNHAEQRQGSEARRKTDDEEHRERQLARCSKPRGPERIEERHLGLVLEELHRKLPGIDFEQARIEEYRSNSDAHRQLDERKRDAFEPISCHDEPSAQRCKSGGFSNVNGRHMRASSPLIMATTRVSTTNDTSARPGSKFASRSSACSAAKPTVCRSASALRNVKVATSRRSIRNSPRAPQISRCTSAGSNSWLAGAASLR